jgi:hypothetical protein
MCRHGSSVSLPKIPRFDGGMMGKVAIIVFAVGITLLIGISAWVISL